MIRRIAGLTFVSLQNGKTVDIYLKHKEKEEKLNKIEKVALTAEGPFSFQLLKIKDDFVRSQILTQGLELISYSSFLKEQGILSEELASKFDMGWCLNLPKDSYTPVQSRTQVHMTKEAKEALSKFVLDSLFYRGIYEETYGPKQRYFPHFESYSTNFRQVYPGFLSSPPSQTTIRENLIKVGDTYSLELFYVYYSPHFLQDCPYKNFIDFIDDAYSHLIKPLEKEMGQVIEQLLRLNIEDKIELEKIAQDFKKFCKKGFDKWIQKIGKQLESCKHKELANDFFNKVILKWIDKKLEGFSELSHILYAKEEMVKKGLVQEVLGEIKSQILVEGEEKLRMQFVITHSIWQSISKNELCNTLQQVLKGYVDLYCQFNSLKKNPKIDFIYDPLNRATAFYTHGANAISLNLSKIKLCDILDIGLTLMKKIPPHHLPAALNLLLVTPSSAGVINHELLHAKEECSCTNVHSSGSNEKGEWVSFETLASEKARKGHRHGSLDLWAKKLEEEIKYPLSTLESILMQLVGLEKTHAKELYAYLELTPVALGNL